MFVKTKCYELWATMTFIVERRVDFEDFGLFFAPIYESNIGLGRGGYTSHSSLLVIKSREFYSYPKR
jgi:hypothetical protein